MSDSKRQLNKNKIILYFLLVLFLSGSCLMWYDLKFNESAVKNKMGIFAQQLPLYFMPSFSQRVMYLSSELALAVQELNFSNQELAGLSTEGCNCKNMQSQCQQKGVGVKEVGVSYCTAGGVFGDPCPEEVRKKLEEKQSEIKSKAAQISRLRQLLMAETKILKAEADEELRENLAILLEESRKIIEFGENTSNLYCNLNQCHADCSQGIGFDFMACLNPAVQNPIEIKFRGGVSLADLSLGDIIIKDMIIKTKNSKVSKMIKEFSKDKDWKYCTLTNFIEWVQKNKENVCKNQRGVRER